MKQIRCPKDNRLMGKVSMTEVTENNLNDKVVMIDQTINVNIIFNDYIQNSLDSRILLYGSSEAIANLPLKERLDGVYGGEKSDKEIEEMVIAKNEETGSAMPSFDADGEE